MRSGPRLALALLLASAPLGVAAAPAAPSLHGPRCPTLSATAAPQLEGWRPLPMPGPICPAPPVR